MKFTYINEEEEMEAARSRLITERFDRERGTTNILTVIERDAVTCLAEIKLLDDTSDDSERAVARRAFLKSQLDSFEERLANAQKAAEEAKHDADKLRSAGITPESISG